MSQTKLQAGYEAQLGVMRTIAEGLDSLDEKSRNSVLAWIDVQWGKRNSITSEVGDVPKRAAALREGTVSVVARKLGAKSARDLLQAAAAHLTLYQGKEKFTKAELVACAKDASGWKSDYSNQIALNIKRMSDADVFFEKAKDVYSLSDVALGQIETKLKS